MRCRRRWKRGKARIASINDRLIFNFQLDDTLEKTLRFVISLLMGDYSSARKRAGFEKFRAVLENFQPLASSLNCDPQETGNTFKSA